MACSNITLDDVGEMDIRDGVDSDGRLKCGQIGLCTPGRWCDEIYFSVEDGDNILKRNASLMIPLCIN